MTGNRITKEMIELLLEKSKVEISTSLPKTTIVKVTLPNGFVLLESSSCVDIDNYDEQIGSEVCLDRIQSQLWLLEGYRLHDDLHLVDDVYQERSKLTQVEEPEVPEDPVFDRASSIVSVVEGGWVNNVNDRGGETIFGMARNFHPNWSGWELVDKYAEEYVRGSSTFIQAVNSDNHIYAKAKNYYKTNYWYVCKCEHMPEEIAICTYDLAINSGNRTAQRQLQEVLRNSGYNIVVDGMVGAITLSAVNKFHDKFGKEECVSRLLNRRYQFFQALVRNNSSQRSFWNGWVNRLIYLGEQLVNKRFKFLKH